MTLTTGLFCRISAEYSCGIGFVERFMRCGAHSIWADKIPAIMYIMRSWIACSVLHVGKIASALTATASITSSSLASFTEIRFLTANVIPCSRNWFLLSLPWCFASVFNWALSQQNENSVGTLQLSWRYEKKAMSMKHFLYTGALRCRSNPLQSPHEHY